MKFVSACFLVIFLTFIFFSLTIVSASFTPVDHNSAQVQEALDKSPPLRFLPSHPLYFLIKVKESFSRFFKSSAVKRAEFDLVLSDKRLKESYLLFNNNENDEALKNLERYSNRLININSQIEKAVAQNQEVAPLASIIANNFGQHEIILSSMYRKYSSNLVLQQAITDFERIIELISDIQPELNGRFKSVKSDLELDEATPEAEIYISPFPSNIPRRIIY